MVLSFQSQPFSFTIDGKPYQLPKLGFGDLETVSAISGAAQENPASIATLIRELLEKKADKRTLEAIDTLAIGDVIELVKAWVGLTPGESSTSGDE